MEGHAACAHLWDGVVSDSLEPAVRVPKRRGQLVPVRGVDVTVGVPEEQLVQKEPPPLGDGLGLGGDGRRQRTLVLVLHVGGIGGGLERGHVGLEERLHRLHLRRG